MYEYKAKVLKVVDGDTLDVEIDLGFHVYHELRLRLNHVDAPEMSTAAGKAAKAYVVSWMTTCPNGTDVIVKTDRDKTEKYGRYLGVVLAAGDFAVGLPSLNDALLASGNARPYSGGAR
jgi:micrococcal nuclease